MSFSNNCKSDKIPGPIRGNATAGLCEKVCIQAEKVFDACMRQDSLTDLSLTLTDVTPGLTEPYRFVSARSSSTEAIVSDLVVTELPDAPCYARITCTIGVPVQVVFTDAYGVTGTGNAVINLSRDVIMHVSAPSVIPYSVRCTAGMVSPKGVYTSGNTFHRVRDDHPQSDDAGRIARPQLWLLLYPALPRVHRTGLRRSDRSAALSAGDGRRAALPQSAARLNLCGGALCRVSAFCFSVFSQTGAYACASDRLVFRAYAPDDGASILAILRPYYSFRRAAELEGVQRRFAFIPAP